MGDEDHPSRFEEEYTHEVIMEAVRESDSPVATAGMIADHAGCSRQTARRKLSEMHNEGLLHRFDAGAAVLWWPAEDDDGELVTDGGRDGMDCHHCEERHSEWTKQGSGPAGPSSAGGHTAWRCDRCGTIEWVGYQ